MQQLNYNVTYHATVNYQILHETYIMYDTIVDLFSVATYGKVCVKYYEWCTPSSSKPDINSII